MHAGSSSSSSLDCMHRPTALSLPAHNTRRIIFHSLMKSSNNGGAEVLHSGE